MLALQRPQNRKLVVSYPPPPTLGVTPNRVLLIPKLTIIQQKQHRGIFIILLNNLLLLTSLFIVGFKGIISVYCMKHKNM